MQNVDELSVRWGGQFAEGLNRGSLGESVEPAGAQANALTAGKLGIGRAPPKEHAKEFTVAEEHVEFMYRQVGKE